MRIGIYGHSIAQWYRQQPHSFITKLKEYYQANIINVGCPAGSEERILFELKKSHNIDLAIIFHANPNHLFIPSWYRDVSSLNKKLTADTMPEIKLWYEADILEFKQWLSDNNIDIDTVDYSELITSLLENKKYLYHPDLQQNRYAGALIQIDQYLKYKNIPVIHCLESHKVPNWFNFSTGVVDEELYKIQVDNKYKTSFSESDNRINAIGNKLIFEKLLELSHTVMRPVVDRNTLINPIRDGGSNPPAAPTI